MTVCLSGCLSVSVYFLSILSHNLSTIHKFNHLNLYRIEQTYKYVGTSMQIYLDMYI